MCLLRNPKGNPNVPILPAVNNNDDRRRRQQTGYIGRGRATHCYILSRNFRHTFTRNNTDIWFVSSRPELCDRPKQRRSKVGLLLLKLLLLSPERKKKTCKQTEWQKTLKSYLLRNIHIFPILPERLVVGSIRPAGHGRRRRMDIFVVFVVWGWKTSSYN